MRRGLAGDTNQPPQTSATLGRWLGHNLKGVPSLHGSGGGLSEGGGQVGVLPDGGIDGDDPVG
jgi:hypothetical protein